MSELPSVAAQPDVRSEQSVHLLPRDGWTESQLSFGRSKPRSPALSLAYRISRVARAVLGGERTLRGQLFLAWAAHRLAHESSIALYGDDFRMYAFGWTVDALRPWLSADASVLDVGCGVGQWSRAVAPLARRVVGIDYDPASLEIARQKTADPRVCYTQADVTRTLDQTLGGECFDLALALHLIEHLEDVDGFLQSLKPLVKRIAVEVPDFESNLLNPIRWAIGEPFYSDADHVREYTLPMLRTQLQRNGWDVVYAEKRGGTILAIGENSI